MPADTQPVVGTSSPVITLEDARALPGTRVLTVIAAPHWGGLHTVVERTTAFYAAHRVTRHVGLPCPEPRIAERLEATGATVHPLDLSRPRKTKNPLTNLAYLARFSGDVRRLVRLIRMLDVQVVEVAGVLNLQPVLAAWLTRRALVWQFHSTLAPAPIRRAIGGLASRTAPVIMTSGAGMIPRHGGLERRAEDVIAFCAPLDRSAFAPDPAARAEMRAKWGYGPDDVVVGTLGNRGWQKRHEMMVEVADRIGAGPFKFAIVGGHVETNNAYYTASVVEPIAARGLSERVAVITQTDPVPRVMNAFDIFMLPSISEGVSLVIAEAMATHLPVVASDVGSLSDTVRPGQTGYLCDVSDPEAFVAALRKLTDPEHRRTLGNGARVLIEAEVSDARCADAHLAAYARIRRAAGASA